MFERYEFKSTREQQERIKWANRASQEMAEETKRRGRELVEDLLNVFGDQPGDLSEPNWEYARVARQQFGCELLAMLIRASGEREFLTRFISRAAGRKEAI